MSDHLTVPKHLAIIMDGNGRWAQARGLPRVLGHQAGAQAVRRIVESACELGVSVLTLYAFSWENWERPREEIGQLMGLLEEFLRGELPAMRKQQIRLRAIGRLEELPAHTQAVLRDVETETAGFQRMTLVLALSYGGRQEVIDAVRRIADEVKAGRLDPDHVDEACLAARLYTAGLPDPDLVIRTSGEQRLSNFLLWQASYAELYVTPKLWPDFTKADLLTAITDYDRRERRYGKVLAKAGGAAA